MWGYCHNSKRLAIRRQFESWLSPWVFFLSKVYECEFCLQLCVYAACVPDRMGARGGGSCFYRLYELLWTIEWMLGTEPNSSAGAVSAPKLWAISPAPSSFPPCWSCRVNSACQSSLAVLFWWPVICFTNYFLCVWTYLCTTAGVWSSEDNLEELV